jgi:ADP-L-glycero-D-manno-heptose 6-epimerase
MSGHKTKLYDDKWIVITGAAGFIGSGVVRHLNDKGYHNLLLVDDFGVGEKWRNLSGKNYSQIVSRYDIFDYLHGRESDIAAFIHLGACSDTTKTDADYFMEMNYRFSIELASYAILNNHRFIYASSAATYGKGEFGFVDDHEKIASLKPMNIYGFSKQAFDLWIKNEGLLDKVVGLKYFNVFGPNENHKGRMASMVYHMTQSIIKDGVVKLFKSNDPKYKDGEQVRDFIYVKDVVKITTDFLENDMMGIYNVGSGRAVSWNELAKCVFEALGKPVNIEYVPMPSDLHYQNYTLADLSKFQKTLKEKGLPSVAYHSIKDAVADCIENYFIPNERW